MRALTVLALSSLAGSSSGAQTQNTTSIAEARIIRVIKDVRVLGGSGAATMALPNLVVSAGASVQTGAASRAELTFGGGALTRLGANTLLGVRDAARDLILNEGALLFQAPRGVTYASIRTGALTTDFAGTTGIVDRRGKSYVKILVMQGTARVFLAGRIGESVLVKAGQILITKPDAKALPEPVDFDIAQLVKTSLLTNRDFAPLPSRTLIEQEIARQKNDPALIGTNLVIYGRGTLVTLADPGKVKNASAKRNAPPTPTPAPSGH